MRTGARSGRLFLSVPAKSLRESGGAEGKRPRLHGKVSAINPGELNEISDSPTGDSGLHRSHFVKNYCPT
jgi:hypothetical protein